MVIIGKRSGQLGNRLFVFAHIIANAMEYGYEVQNPSFFGYCQYFVGTRDDFFCRYPARKTWLRSSLLQALFYRIINKGLLPLSRCSWIAGLLNIVCLEIPTESPAEQCYDMRNPDYLSLATSSHMLIIKDAWSFRDFHNFNKHADRIRTFFTPIERHSSAVSNLVSKARNGCDLLVGIHIRQGDYKRWRGGKFYFSTSEYAKVMERFAATMPEKRIRFMICSNEKQDEVLFRSLDYVMGNNHQLEDMYAFSQCDLLIGPPSTFTAWASFYGSVPLFTLNSASDPIHPDDFHI